MEFNATTRMSASSGTVFYVAPIPQGGWAVFGPEIAPPLSTFDARGDACLYACNQADRAELGEVQILTPEGSVEEYLVRESAAASRPACRRAISLS